MSPLGWAALAGTATAIGLSLVTRKAKAQVMPPPVPAFDPTQTYGETEKVVVAIPAGWRRATNDEVRELPELARQAIALRNATGFTSMQYGTLSPFTASDGRVFATFIEQHFHEPGGAIRPWGLHHGVTLLASLS